MTEYVFKLAVDHKDVALSRSARVLKALSAVDGRIRTSGFKRAVIEAVTPDALIAEQVTDPSTCEHLASVHDRVSLLPDAYLIDADNSTIVCYEVEDTHNVRPSVASRYMALWWVLDSLGWDLLLIAYDVWGFHRAIDLAEVAAVAFTEVEPPLAPQAKRHLKRA